MQLDYMVTRLYGNLIIWISKKGLLQNIVILQYMAAISMIFMRYIVEIYHFATASFYAFNFNLTCCVRRKFSETP